VLDSSSASKCLVAALTFHIQQDLSEKYSRNTKLDNLFFSVFFEEKNRFLIHFGHSGLMFVNSGKPLANILIGSL
jgi:hypothetical protein